MLELDTDNLGIITASPEWQLYRTQLPAYGLVSVIQNLGDSVRGIELGIGIGTNSCMLLESCCNIDLLVGIDHYNEYKSWDRYVPQHEQDYKFVRIKNNIQFLGPSFNLLRMSSTEAVFDLEDDAYDFVFINADHAMRAVLIDLDSYWPKIKSGGIISGHNSNIFSVSFAVTSWVKRKGIDPANIQMLINRAWWFRKP